MTINNNNIFGAFTLGEVRSGRLTGDWLNKETVANYGWFGGGSAGAGSISSTVDRIDFSNDLTTPSIRSSLSAVRGYTGATGNSNYGWFGGGSTPGVSLSSVERIDFSNDLAVTSPRGPLSQPKVGAAAAANSNYGWFGGGATPTPTPAIPTNSTVDRIDFANDSPTASVRGSLSLQRQSSGATGNSNYGWFGGGGIPTPAVFSTVDRIDFSNDLASASPRGSLSLSRYRPGATGNSNYGWFGGGGDLIGFRSFLSIVDRIDFVNDSSTALVRGPLSQPKVGAAAAGNSNYGWWSGGYIPSGTPGRTSRVDRIDFSNDTGTALIRGLTSPAPSARFGAGATSGVLNIRRQKAGNYGWFGGGAWPGNTLGRIVDRIDFSNDSTTALARSPLTSVTYQNAATANSNYGWIAGGFPSPIKTTVQRIDFSNDSSTSPVRGPLTAARAYFAATGNSNYGWFAGGQPQTATVDRIDFSNDLATAPPRGSLSADRKSFAATGNSNYGWIVGGDSPSQSADELLKIYRIDFSNDFATTTPRGRLISPSQITDLSATGNSNYGWFGGGQSPVRARVDRIDFSNDLVIPLQRGSLSSPKRNTGATGNSNYGWFGGGRSPVIATVDRIDFSNDSPSVSVRGPLSSARYSLAATSNTNK